MDASLCPDRATMSISRANTSTVRPRTAMQATPRPVDLFDCERQAFGGSERVYFRHRPNCLKYSTGFLTRSINPC